jgi:hypothetical protein
MMGRVLFFLKQTFLFLKHLRNPHFLNLAL